MTPRSNRSRAAFTLVETSITTVLVALSVTVLATTAYTFLDSGAAHADRGETRQSAAAVVREIEQAIRASETIVAAGADYIEIETRFFFDTDEEIETVAYRLQAGALQRELSNGGTRTTETLLESVDSFTTYYFSLEDDFDTDDFVALAAKTRGPPSTVNTALQADYALMELSALSASFVASYNDVTASIAVGDATSGDSVALSPPLVPEGLTATVDFTVSDGTATYHALEFGDEALNTNGVVIEFSGGSIGLRVFEGSAETGRVSNAATYVAGETIPVRLDFVNDYVYASYHDGNEWRAIGSATAPALSTGRVWVRSRHREGEWDALRVWYSLVDIVLTVEDDRGEILKLFGGARPR